MNKVWLHTFWFAWGEIRPAVSDSRGVQPVVQKAWMRSVFPPYYRGVGVAVKLGRNTARFGVCYPAGKLTRPDTTAEIIEAVFGRDVDQGSEGSWQSGTSSEERSA